MRTRSTGIIGLLVSDIANPFYARIINSLEATLQAAGYTLILANTRGSRHREKALADMLRRRRVDGLIVAPCEAEAPEDTRATAPTDTCRVLGSGLWA